MSLVKFIRRVARSNRGNINDQLTIPIGKVKPLIKLLIAEGIALNPLLDNTGISPSDLTLFTLPIRYDQYLQLIRNAYRLSPESGFALKLGEQFYLNHDGLLACRIMSSENSLQAMTLLDEYQSLFTRLFQFDFDVQDEHAVFTVYPAVDLGDLLPFFIEYTFTSIYSIGKFCIGSQHLDLSYEFSYEETPALERYQEFFGDKLTFGCDHNRAIIPNEILQHPFVFADKQKAKLNDDICQSKIHSIENEFDIRQRVETFVRKNKFSDISLESLAEQLCMSPRTLSRQLKVHNVSYKEIVEDERKKIAAQRILKQSVSLERLAEQLGYQNLSSFSRAFKQWFGVSPAKFKEQVTSDNAFDDNC